jgi:hypothetical protein
MLTLKNMFLSFATLTTLNILAQQVILSESFDNGIPQDWSVIDGDNLTVHPSVSEFQPAWIGLEDPFMPGNKIAGSTSYFQPEGKAFRFLVTPQITLGAYGNFLSWQSMSHDPSFPDWIMILISTSGNNIEDFTDTLFRLNNEFPYWTERTISLSDSKYLNKEVYIAFVNHTNQGFKLYLDSVKVEVNNPVALNEHAMQNTSIFPNPATGDQIFLSGEETVESIKFLDSSGRLIKQENNPMTALHVGDLPIGLYFVQITSSTQTRIVRFVKQ